MKKIIALLLAVMLLATVFAGCAAKLVEPETAEYYLTDEDVPLPEYGQKRTLFQRLFQRRKKGDEKHVR